MVETRRGILLQRMLTAWDKAAAQNPKIDWGKSTPKIAAAEKVFEHQAARYLASEIEIEALKFFFDERTNAYRLAIKDELDAFNKKHAQ